MGFFDFLHSNPANKANQYISQIPAQTQQYFDPYIQSGNRASQSLEEQYKGLLSNPGKKLNQFGEGFHESPGFQFALQQALQGSNHAAAAGGMAGTPAHEQQNMEIASQLGNQDYYNWLQKTLGLYGSGLEGENQMSNRGFQASNQMADMIAQSLAQQGNYAYEGEAGKNAMKSQLLGSAIGLGSKLFFA